MTAPAARPAVGRKQNAMTSRARSSRPTLAVLTAGLLVLGGCGKGGGDEAADTIDSSTPGARNFIGQFANVAGAPADAPKVTGVAEMTVADGRTRVDVLVAGLDAKTTYIAHVYDDVCSASDPGGAHFKFKADGDAEPPNEIHLPIKLAEEVKIEGKPAPSDTRGGTGDVTVDGEAGDGAKSVLIHVLRKPDATVDEAKPPKLACADLKPDDGSVPAAPSAEATAEATAEPTAEPTSSANPAKPKKAKKSAAPEPTDSADPDESASPEPPS